MPQFGEHFASHRWPINFSLLLLDFIRVLENLKIKTCYSHILKVLLLCINSLIVFRLKFKSLLVYPDLQRHV